MAFKAFKGFKGFCGAKMSKKAEDGYSAMANSMRSAFCGGASAPAPKPAPADVSSGGSGDLGSSIAASMKRAIGG